MFSNILYSKTITLPVVPAPQIVTELKGSFKLPSKINIVLLGEKAEENRIAATHLVGTLGRFQRADADIQTGIPEKKSIVLHQYTPSTGVVLKPYESNPEGYFLRISPDGILIKSTTSKGLFYGAMSLIQMLEKSSNLPAVEVEDWPDMKVRGISDDISRGQVSTLENFQSIIRFMARYKMNTYMPYIEDMLKLDSYPSIGRGRGALTKDEVKKLVEYAKLYYVDIIPIFQTLGHFENILVQKEFLPYAEFPGAASLNVSYDSTYIFLENMIKEVAPLFPSEYFHMGADESHDVGLGKSRTLVEKTDMAQVHLQHYIKVYQILKKYGKKVMMYGDIILNRPGILEGLPKDIVIVDWHYRPDYDYPSTRVFRDAGHQYYVSPSVWNFQTSFPTNINAMSNIKYITRAGLDNGAAGMINSNWGDYGAETLKELNALGYAYSAQCAWSYKLSNENEFTRAFLYDFYGIDDDRLFYIYQAMGNPINEVLWHDLWRHPLLPFREPNWWDARIPAIAKSEALGSLMPKIAEDVARLETDVKKNNEQLQMLKLMTDIGLYFKDKLSVQYLLQEQLAGRKGETSLLMKKIDENLSSLEALKISYRRMWLKYYKAEGLSLIEDKFDRLAGYFREIKRDLTAGTLRSPEIPSRWIYCPLNDSEYAASAEFKKEFTLNARPDTALLQLIGDTHARVYVNGKYAGEVYARRTLSLSSELERVKIFDVTPMLTDGGNTVTVLVDNYNNKGAAGMNLMLHIKTAGTVTEMLSDTTWSSRMVKESGKNDGQWGGTAERIYPFVISAPDFATMRKSWIER